MIGQFNLTIRSSQCRTTQMSIWGKLAGAAAGLAIGGPLGALVGAVAGHFAVDRQQSTDPDTPPQNHIAFTIGVIALGAKMAKADGVVTRDEVDAFRQVFQVPPEEIKNVARVFDLAKRDVAGFDAYAKQMADLFAGNSEVLEDVLDGLFHIAKADGVIHPDEATYLEEVARIFGFDEGGFARIRARHLGPDKGDPYLVLGVSRDDSDDQIKQAYRRLVAENHPDKAIARGVPEELIAIANEKLAAINAAYDQIEKERGF